MAETPRQPADLAGWQARAAMLRPPTGCFIDGGFRPAAGEETFVSLDPATGDVVALVARGRAPDIDVAVEAARRVFRSGEWSTAHPRERAAVLRRFADLIEQHADELALYDVLEMGKPITDALTYDVPQVAESLRFFGEVADKVGGMTTLTDHDALHYTLREPLGVVGCISPWNYPLLMAAWKFAPALAAGNSVVLKPAEEASLSCLRAAELFCSAGGPAGVFNVVPGFGPEAGQALARHHDVDKIAFTGSTEVGRLMLQYAGESNLKRVSLECGGKSPQIVFADADLDAAAEAVAEGIFGNAGQVCNAGSRVLVAASVVADFEARFIAATERQFTIGSPLDPATTLGPLVSADARRRVEAMIAAADADSAGADSGASDLSASDDGGRGRDGEDASSRRARRILDQRPPAGLAGGAYVAPTAFADVDPGSPLATDEVFGPVAAFMTFSTYDEAIELANDTIYGLAAGVWTSDLSTAHRAVRDLDVGTIWVNTFNDGDFGQPFGGYKQSGNSKDDSAETLLAYTQTKSAWFRL